MVCERGRGCGTALPGDCARGTGILRRGIAHHRASGAGYGRYRGAGGFVRSGRGVSDGGQRSLLRAPPVRSLWMVPNDAEALALRAAARRQSGDRAGALADAEAAVGADPGSAVAYFERGAAKAMNGDRDGARADWQYAEQLDPGGETGQLAATNRLRLP